MDCDRREEQRRIVKRIFAQGWNEADFEGIEAWIAADAKFHFNQCPAQASCVICNVVAKWSM
jgi:hypothetical protein